MENNSILYKNTKYLFNTNFIKNNHFSIYDLSTNSEINIDNNLVLNNYNNLYYILKKNNITNSLFTSYITNKPLIQYKITYNSITNTISFNNSNIPILYSNYIYSFDISSLKNFYIFFNFNINIINNNNINNNNFINIYNNSSYIYLILNDTIYDNNTISHNNILHNQILYYYYLPITINSSNNILTITEFDGFTNHTLNLVINSSFYNVYNFTINQNNYTLNNNLINILNNQLKNINRGSNFTFSINNNQIILSHTTNNFSITKNNLYTSLNFTTNLSFNKQIKIDIKYLSNIFTTDSYLNYYGSKIQFDYFTLSNFYDNNNISVDLLKHQHINLPSITNNNTYTFIINNTAKNKYLYLHSTSIIYYENKKSNILVLKPDINKSLIIGSYIKIYANNNYYIFFENKNIYSIESHYVKIYNSKSNFSNLYYNNITLSYFDKYISIFNIHIIGLKTSHNQNLNELKFLHIAKTLAKLLDYNNTGKPSDINIVNTLTNLNSYIVLYDNHLPYNFITDSQHKYYISIDYNSISLDYDFNYNISTNNIYDNSLEKLLQFISYSYINTYPHQFKYDFNSSLDLYKHIKTDLISDTDLIIEDLRTNKTDISITNMFYNDSKIINSNNTNGRFINYNP